MSILRTLILIYYLCWVICFKISICVLTWDVSVQLISSKDLFLALNYIFYHILDVMQIALFIPDSSLSFSLSYFHQKGKFSLKLNCYAHVKPARKPFRLWFSSRGVVCYQCVWSPLMLDNLTLSYYMHC